MQTKTVHQFNGKPGVGFYEMQLTDAVFKLITKSPSLRYSVIFLDKDDDSEQLELALSVEGWRTLAANIIHKLGVNSNVQKAYKIATEPDRT